MNGWLFPSGKFLTCEIGEHGKVAHNLTPSKKGGYIHIFPRGAFADVPPTKKQREWLIASLETIKDETYKDMVEMILER